MNLRIEPCLCGHPICKKVFIRGEAFHPEGRFERTDAEEIVKKLEAHDALVAALLVFVQKYKAKPDGDLGFGFVNADFGRAALALVAAGVQI